MKRTRLLIIGGVVVLLAGLWWFGRAPEATVAQADLPVMTVYKNPTCGCCGSWIGHLKASGFRVATHEMQDVQPVKAQYRIPGSLASCHTGIIEGYAIEGHVPADVVKRLLDERPDIAGLAVPGMPTGAPGMEGPNPEHYQVIAFRRDGSRYVFAQR